MQCGMWDLSSPTRELWAFPGSYWAWGWVCAVLCLVTQSCPALCDPMDGNMPDFLALHCLPGFAQTHVHWVNDAIQPSHSLMPPFPFGLNLSQHQVLFSASQLLTSGGQSVGTLASSNEYSGLISFKIDWFDLLSVQLTLKSLLQHHNLQTSILRWWLALNCAVWLIGISIKVYIYIYIHAKSLHSCPTLCDPMGCSLPGSSVHGILQARVLEWVAMPSSTYVYIHIHIHCVCV